MKNKVAIISFLLVILLLVGCSANDGSEHDSSTYDFPDVVDTTGRPIASDNTVADLDGKTVEILCWNGAEQVEFENVKDGSTSILGEAVYRRNLMVQNHLNCTLNFSYADGSVSDAMTYIKKATADDMFDIFAAHNLVMPRLAVKGECANLFALQGDDTIDFSDPWWPSNLTKTLCLNDKLFFCTGDISTNYYASLYGVFFNKRILSSNGIDPNAVYQSVENGQWTLDTLQKYSAECASDENGVRNYGFALGVNADPVKAFYCAANFEVTSSDGNGSLSLVINESTLEDEKILLKELKELFTSDSSTVSWSNSHNGTAVFTSGNAAFTVSEITYAKSLNNNVDYGIVPVPHPEPGSGTYITPVSDGYTFYAVNAKTPENDRLGAIVLQSLAATAYNLNYDAYYKSILGVLFDISNANVRMVELMKTNCCFSFFECWLSAYTSDTEEIIKKPSQLFAQSVVNSSSTHVAQLNYALLIEKYRPIYSKVFDELMEFFSGK